jgi:hypothetical protein
MMKPRADVVEMMIGDIQRADAATVVVGALGAKKVQINDVMKARNQGSASKVKIKHRAGKGDGMMYNEGLCVLRRAWA